METPCSGSTRGTSLLQDSHQKFVDPGRKILRRFYEPLLLLEALKRASQTRSSSDIDEPTSTSTTGFRRAFVDSIAYLCAAERFSNNVTAAGLTTTPQGPVLWLATNDGASDPTRDFAKAVLEDIHLLAAQEAPMERHKMAESVSQNILRRAVTFGIPRLQKYVNNIRNIKLTQCTSFLRRSQARDAESIPRVLQLCAWLEETFVSEEDVVRQPSDWLQLVLKCYILRKGRVFEPLLLFSSQNGQHASDLARLSQLLSKLGKHVTTTRKLVEAAAYLRDDFCEPIVVRKVPASPERKFPLLEKEGTVSSILGRATSSSDEKEKFQVRLQSLWNAKEIETVLEKERPRKTKVHAELLLADHIHRHNLRFLDGEDRYIGCSKPTCYLCDAYLRNHPAAFAVPRSHQKIYLQWRCPDVARGRPDTHEAFEEQGKMWRNLIDWVRKDLEKEMNSRAPRVAMPPDSTAGITSENHLPFAPFDLSKMTDMLRVEEDARAQNAIIDKKDASPKKEPEQESNCGSDVDEDGGALLV